jgi:hypothetical protein
MVTIFGLKFCCAAWHHASALAYGKGRTHGCTDQGCKREESSCQLGAVHTWHLADMRRCTANVSPAANRHIRTLVAVSAVEEPQTETSE